MKQSVFALALAIVAACGCAQRCDRMPEGDRWIACARGDYPARVTIVADAGLVCRCPADAAGGRQ